MTIDLSTLEPGQSLFKRHKTIDADAIEAYLSAVEDDCDVYATERVAPPMAVAALVMSEALKAIELPAGAVHTAQELEFAAPVQEGEELTCEAKVSQNSVRRGTRFLVLEITGDMASERAVTGRVSLAIAGVEEGDG